MADLLIRGMDMPKDCPMCPLAHWNKLDRLTGCELGPRYVPKSDADYWQSDVRPDWCPLAELEPVYKKNGRRYIFAMWAEVPKHYTAETNTNKGKSEAEDAISLFKQLACGVVFFCDPDKNTECSKEGCFINGGPCYLTKRREFEKEIW